MVFLLRSALCIGVVVLALPREGSVARDAALRSGASAARAFCRSDPGRCAAALEDGVSAMLPPAPEARAPRAARTAAAEPRGPRPNAPTRAGTAARLYPSHADH